MKELFKMSVRKGSMLLLCQIVFISVLASIVFQVIDERKFSSLVLIIGFFLGLAFWFFEHLLFNKWGKRLSEKPLMVAILLKALVYLIAIYLIMNVIGFTHGIIVGKTLAEFYDSLIDREQLILYAYGLLLFSTLSFYTQVNHLIGEGVLPKFLLGYYRKPVREHRIFMFLDLKSSTTIAERLGAELYYAFLNDFFHEVSEPARVTSAEIYQYVGDEIVFTWQTHHGLSNNNCLRLFFKIKERVNKHKAHYQKKYGIVPEFKAGLHLGEVIAAEIGDLKREIVYNGDVLNTCARIQEQCKMLGKELLLSNDLLHVLITENQYEKQEMGNFRLRGKESEVRLISLSSQEINS